MLPTKETPVVQRVSNTLIGRLFPSQLDEALPERSRRLFLEAFIYTLVAYFLSYLLRLPNSGFISIFLTSISLGDRTRYLLIENRQNIYESDRTSWETNRLTAISLLALFTGILSAYFIIALTLGTPGILREFGFAVDAAGLSQSDLLTRHFNSFELIFNNNIVVLVCITMLAFVYQSYGAMLALGWNACVWAFAITVLTLQTIHSATAAGPLKVLLSATCLLPHLILEGLAYITGALAAIFFSRAVSQYAPENTRFKNATRVCIILFGVAMAMVFVAAVLESTLVPAILNHLRPAR